MENIIQKLTKDKLSLDILFAIDELFEKEYLYVYPGVLDYIIEGGPHILRHWVGLIFKTYSYPNKNVLETFNNLSIKYDIKRHKEKIYYGELPTDPLNPSLIDRAYYSYQPMEQIPEEKYIDFYRIYLLIPKEILNFDWSLPHIEKLRANEEMEKNDQNQENKNSEKRQIS